MTSELFVLHLTVVELNLFQGHHLCLVVCLLHSSGLHRGLLRGHLHLAEEENVEEKKKLVGTKSTAAKTTRY